jgi:DNA-binding NarL/FixJ family response regulator
MNQLDPAAGSRVLIVEDDAQARDMELDLLTQAGFVAATASSGEEALSVIRDELPRVVVLDVKLPGVSGYEVLRQLRDEFGEVLPVLLVSGVRPEPYDRAAGLMAGADDYLTKPFAPEEFVARVRALMRRAAPRPEGIGALLTSRESEVLRLLAQGLTQEEIAQDLVLSPRTIGTHIEHILAKLGARSRAQAVALAHQDETIGPSLRASVRSVEAAHRE